MSMHFSNIVGGVLLAGVAVVLSGSRAYGQNPGHHADHADPTAAQRPKDIDPESRNRLPYPKREDMNAEEQKIFDELMRPRSGNIDIQGRRQPPLRFHSPRVAKPMAEAHRYVKFDTGFGARLTEIAVLTTARELDNVYEWTQWEEHGQTAGDPPAVERAVIDIIKYCKPAVGIGEKEAAIINLGREIFGKKKVSSATFAEALRLFGKRGIVDLVELMALYAATGAELIAFDVQLHEGQKPTLPARADVPECRNR